MGAPIGPLPHCHRFCISGNQTEHVRFLFGSDRIGLSLRIVVAVWGLVDKWEENAGPSRGRAVPRTRRLGAEGRRGKGEICPDLDRKWCQERAPISAWQGYCLP